MTKLQNIQENTLTKKTIIPLMEKLGFLKVEFNGGVQEEGKDIICWEEDRLKNTRVIVAQVKHFKFTNSQSDQYSLNNVINQLTQCFIKPIPFTDKKYYTPYESYLISTFPIDTQTLKTRFSENPTLIDRKIEIIDGYKLSELIIQHLPDQASEYLEEAIEVKLIAEKDFNNKTVLKALGFQEQLHLKNIYTDIDFSLGKTTTRLFFSNQYNPSIKRFEIDKDSWKRFKEIIVSTEKTFGTSYITQSLNDIEINFEQEIEQSKEWEKHKKSIQLDIMIISPHTDPPISE